MTQTICLHYDQSTQTLYGELADGGACPDGGSTAAISTLSLEPNTSYAVALRVSNLAGETVAFTLASEEDDAGARVDLGARLTGDRASGVDSRTGQSITTGTKPVEIAVTTADSGSEATCICGPYEVGPCASKVARIIELDGPQIKCNGRFSLELEVLATEFARSGRWITLDFVVTDSNNRQTVLEPFGPRDNPKTGNVNNNQSNWGPISCAGPFEAGSRVGVNIDGWTSDRPGSWPAVRIPRTDARNIMPVDTNASIPDDLPADGRSWFIDFFNERGLVEQGHLDIGPNGVLWLCDRGAGPKDHNDLVLRVTVVPAK